MERFEQIRELGTGSYGRAILVKIRGEDRLLVVKQMFLPYLQSSSQQIDDYPRDSDQAKIVELAYQEVKLLTSIKHPNIVQAFEAFADNGAKCLNLVMEYCDGGDLNLAISQQNGVFFPESTIQNWFSQLIFAVKFLHDRKILHRDIKAANIFLTNERRVVKLGDLGIAKVLDRTGDLTKTMIGTPAYLSPELCDGLPYGEKSEVWSLGVVLYQMSALNLPFVESNLPALLIVIKSKTPPSIPSQYCVELRNLLDKMLEKDAEFRPSVDQLVTDNFLLSAIVELVAKGVTITDSPSPTVEQKSLTPSADETIKMRPDDEAVDDELVSRIRNSKAVETIFKEPLIAILRDQLLTAKTLVSLSEEELKELCPKKKGLQLALMRLVQQLKEDELNEACHTLKEAIEQKDCDKIRLLAKSLDSSTGNVGDIVVDQDVRYTALQLASKLGQTDPLKLLLSLGADMTLRNRYDDQALHVASYAGRLVAVDILLRNKAEVGAVGQLGRTPLHMAAASGYQNVAALLLQHGADAEVISSPEDLCQTPLLVACFYGHVGIVRLLLDKANVKLNSCNLHGDSALHIATVQNKAEVVKLLLDKAGPGIADLLEFRGYRGRTPLHAAAAWGRADIARILLSKGANVRAQSNCHDECCDTPLHLAAYYGHTDVLKVIIDADQSAVELRNENDETPLSRACFNGQLATARLLLNRGAATNIHDKNNKTPLYYAKLKSEQCMASSNGNENAAAAIVQLLMQNRQNVTD